MANCIKCGKSVGCGCQLVSGVCEKCRAAEVVKANQPTVQVTLIPPAKKG